MTAQLMSQNVPIVSSPSGIFCVLRHPNHFALPTDSSRPLFKQIEIFCIECFHSRGQHICKFIGTKESVCIRKEFNSQRTGLGHQHGRRFIVLGHQYGRRDVM